MLKSARIELQSDIDGEELRLEICLSPQRQARTGAF